ncbi:MAG: glycosyltransferase family 39 protein, partial [Alphaproteobacteria bacterium]|nr:glycosyltransferase family 39 protein [Alphaproteobacteria bacterium]
MAGDTVSAGLGRANLWDLLASRPYAALLLICLLVWLPGFFSLPVLDRDEARFAQSSKQMVESGDWVNIRFGQAPRYKKPAGIYWLQAVATESLGRPPYTAIWTYRLPSLLGALAAVFLSFWCFQALAPPKAALAAAMLLGLSLGVSAEAHIAKTDAMLLACTVAAQSVLLRIYLRARAQASPPPLPLILLGWTAVAAGILIKGPVILGVLALSALGVSVWDREWGWLKQSRPWPGIALMLALIAPWFVAIGFVSHGQFFVRALGHDFAAKLAGGQESHGAPPGYYLLLSTLTLWPATIGVLPGLSRAFAWRDSPGLRFVLSWAIGSWLMFAIVPTKLPHYILPVYPALAALSALWLADQGPRGRWENAFRIAAAIQFAVGAIILGAAISYAPTRFGSGTPIWLLGLSATGIFAGLVAAYQVWREQRGQALLAAILAALIFYPSLMWGTAPRLQRIWLSPRLARIVERNRRPDDPPIIVSGYDEP